MYFDLTDDQQQFVSVARDYAAGELAPNAAKWDAEHIFPRQAIATAGALGFCGLYASEEYGGLGQFTLHIPRHTQTDGHPHQRHPGQQGAGE